MGDYMVIPDRLLEILEKLKLKPEEALWKLPQNGKPVIKHFALERAAAYLDIKFSDPHVIESNPADRICILWVEGKLGDKSEWSIGEAAPYNIDRKTFKQPYPYAMGEKRAKDRVILKLLNLHGEVYSEDEMNDQESTEDPTPPPPPKQEEKTQHRLLESLDLIKNPSEAICLQWFKRNESEILALEKQDPEKYKILDKKFADKMKQAQGEK